MDRKETIIGGGGPFQEKQGCVARGVTLPPRIEGGGWSLPGEEKYETKAKLVRA